MVRYNIEKHAIGFPAKCLATEGGKHIFNIELKEDTDNGWFVGKGAFKSLDLYEEAVAGTATGKVVAQAGNGNYYVEIESADGAYFVSTVPMVETDWNNNFKKESNFFNGVTLLPDGSVDTNHLPVGRCYELAVGDIVEISETGFGAKPSIGGSVSLQAVVGSTYAKQFA